MYRIRIRRDICKGCGLCIEFCPKKLLGLDEQLNARGVKPATCQGHMEDCIGCGNCAAMCPDAAIEIEEVEEIDEDNEGDDTK
jgi:2-oxoglutarate ferredoxin oxidoreductase subunit delta